MSLLPLEDLHTHVLAVVVGQFEFLRLLSRNTWSEHLRRVLRKLQGRKTEQREVLMMKRQNKVDAHAGVTEELRLIGADELAELLDVSTRTVWRLLSTGRLVQPVRIGGSVRWRLDEVRDWIKNGCPVVTQ